MHEGATWRVLRDDPRPARSAWGRHHVRKVGTFDQVLAIIAEWQGYPRRTERQNEWVRGATMKAGPVRSNEGSKDTQLNGSTDLGFLDAAEELRQLQTPIPSKADAIREAVMEAIKQSAIKQNTFEQS